MKQKPERGLSFPKSNPRVFVLPDTFSSVSVTDEEGREIHVVIERNDPPSYDKWLIETRYYSENARLLRGLLQGEGTLIDLGANIGTVCLPVAAAGSRVIAVEMLPRNVSKLILSTLLNDFPYIRVVQAAVSDADGFIGYAGAEAWGHVSSDEAAHQAVSQRLDTIIDMIELESPGFINGLVVMKLDIEGHELAALKGAPRVLEKYRPAFVFESIISANLPVLDAEAVKVLVAGAGYDMFMLRGRVLSPHAAGMPQLGLVSDILAVPKEKLDLLHRLVPDYEIRELTPDEEMDWLVEMARGEEAHRAHAASVIDYLRTRRPEMKESLEQLARTL